MSAAMHPDDGVPRPRRRTRRILLAFLLCLALGIGGYFYMSYRAEKRLEAAIAAADRLDPGWRLEDLESRRPPLADDKNSALIAADAANLISRGWNNFATSNTFRNREPHSASQLTDEQVQILRAQMKLVAQAVTKARKLKDVPSGRFNLAGSADPISALLPHVQSIRGIATLLSYDAMLRAQDNDLDGALESCLAALGAARSFSDESTYIEALVRIAIRAVTMGRLEQVLSQGQASEAMLAAVQRAVDEEERFPLLLATSRGERALGDRRMVDAQEGKTDLASAVASMGPGGAPTPNEALNRLIGFIQVGSLASNRAALLELHNEIIEIAKLPENARKGRLEQLRASMANAPVLVRLLLPAMEKTAEAITRSAAQMRTAGAALAAERYRKANGRWPNSLVELVPAYLEQAPSDPYDGAPLRLRRLEDGLVIYSIGLDEKDNGGTLGDGVSPGTDIGFRLWDMPRRRQPALPLKPDDKKP